MKTKAILATLLVAAAASADARLASPFPRKAVPPDESGHWIVINGNPWSHDVKSKLATFADGQTRRGEASLSGGGPDGLKSSPTKKEKAESSRLECFILRGRHQPSYYTPSIRRKISNFLKYRSSNA